MKIEKIFKATIVLSLFVMMSAIDSYAQNTNKDDKKDETKVTVVEKVVEKSGPSIEQELKKIFNVKTETSLTGPRIENLGKFFLDKYTGEVMIVGEHKFETVRWRVYREEAADDIVNDRQSVNYQLIRYGNADNTIVLININTGAMWVMEFKGLLANEKNAILRYIPMRNTER